MKLPKQLLGERPPQWAMPIGRQEFTEFKSHLSAALTEFEIDCETEWEKGGIKVVGSPLFFGLENLIVDWKRMTDASRKEIVRSFAGAIAENLAASNIPIADNLDDLRIRLCSDNGMPANNEFITRQIGDHMHGLLVLEGEKAVAPVTQDGARESGKSHEELLDIALANVWKFANPQLSRKETDIGMFTYIDCEVFGATMMMLLDKFTERDETYWACAPCRDTTIILKPISPERAHLEKFFALVGHTSQRSNYSIEAFVFEYRNGELTDLCEVDEDYIKLKP